MESSLTKQKKSLFSHVDPSLAIREMKTVNNHLNQTRNLLHETLGRMANIKVGVSNTSTNLLETNNMYENYEEKMKKADLLVKNLQKK